MVVDAMNGLLATAVVGDGLSEKRCECHWCRINPTPCSALEFLKNLSDQFFRDELRKDKSVGFPQHIESFLDFAERDSSSRISL
jgi:hypothetical protein